MMYKRAFIAIVLLLLIVAIAPIQAQDGRGVIVIGLPGNPEDVGGLNPLLCSTEMCQLLSGLLFPTLQAVDPIAGTYILANDDNIGLTQNIEIVDDQVAIFTLRDDLLWSDGTAITAYDVFYSYLVAVNPRFTSAYSSLGRTVIGAIPLDDYRIAFLYENANCGTLDRTDFPIIPAHIFEPEIRDYASTLSADGDLIAQYEQWVEDEVYPLERYNAVRTNPFNTEPTVTAGVYRFDEFRPLESIRLVSVEDSQAILATVLPSGLDQMDYFLEGQSSLLMNPSYEHWVDLMARDDLQIATYPGETWDYISFNTADPFEPEDAFDEDGERIEQGHHPIFGDVRVRRAIQLAINIPELIDISVNGYGTPMVADQLPHSWAFNDTLSPIEQNIREAERLLNEAGWRDTNGDGVRDCIGCLYARTGYSLSFDLMYFDGRRYDIMARLITDQLGRIGIRANPNSSGTSAVLSSARGQQYDAYLGGWFQPFPVNPDHYSLFSSVNDIRYVGQNAGSYYNPTIDALLEEALNVANCDAETRANIYHEVQTILQEDQPYVWLFAPHEMILAQNNVLGFNPIPNAPFWNIRDWTIVD